MKFVLSVFIWIAIIGSVVLYIETRKEIPPIIISENQAVVQAYDVELLVAFPLEPDPFEVRQEKKTPSTLKLYLNGKKVLDENNILKEMKPLLYKNIIGLEQGRNELYIEAFAPISYFNKNLALRLRILKGNSVYYEKTFWSDGENSIREAFIIDVARNE
jgi:hypothetical protein